MDKLVFTKRNLHALSFIFERINKIDDDELKAVFRFAFISMIHLATHLPSVRENSDRVGSGSWGRPNFLKMRKQMELNLFVLFERAIEDKQGVIKGKINSNKLLHKKIKLAKTVKELDSDKNLLLLQKNTLELTNLIKIYQIFNNFVITKLKLVSKLEVRYCLNYYGQN